MPPRRSPSIGLVTAALLIVPLTLLGACAGQGGGDGDSANSDEADTESESEPDTESESESESQSESESEPGTESESETPPSAEPLTTEVLLGDWAKVDDGDPACADYPDQLTFESFGYLTSLHDDRAAVLDGGSWEIDGDRLLLSNPIDAVVSYPVALTDDVLELDTGTCTVRYRRLGGSGS